MQVILYNQDNGIPAIVCPTPEALQTMTVMQIAVKDVPAGKPFKIVDAADLPDAPQEAWVLDDAALTDGIGGQA